MILEGEGGGEVCIERGRGESIRGGGGGGSELSDQLLDPDVPTLASQDKLKVSPKGLPFVTKQNTKSEPSTMILFLARTSSKQVAIAVV